MRPKLSSEDETADGDGGDDAGEVGDEAGGDGVAGAADGHRTEVDGENVERRFRAAHDGAGHAGEQAVRSVGGDEFGEDAHAAAAAQRAHEGHGEEFGGEADHLENGIERAADEIDAAGAAEHANGHKDGDEKGNDAEGDLDAFLGAFDEFFVNRHPAEGGVEGKKRKEERDGEEGNGGDIRCKPAAVSVIAFARGAPEKKEKNKNELKNI